ncbi:basic proline-rich protein-like [Sciurus carolinensis]|uniref:basic proline-rich protein-like n=1 Tax=Sciurus carolinensis TaxID=30640 RepID=UPI001FB1C22E|nr:basic proline-rich protein-like [Sciurus carolinensis]
MCHDQQVLQTTCGHNSLCEPPTALITSSSTRPGASSEGVRGPLTSFTRASATTQSSGFPQLPTLLRKVSTPTHPTPFRAWLLTSRRRSRAPSWPFQESCSPVGPDPSRRPPGRCPEPGDRVARLSPGPCCLRRAFSSLPSAHPSGSGSSRPASAPGFVCAHGALLPGAPGAFVKHAAGGSGLPSTPGARPAQPPPQDRRHLPPLYLSPSEPGGAVPTALRKPPGTQRTPALSQCALLAAETPGRQNPRGPLPAPHPPAAAVAPANTRQRLGAGPESGRGVPFPAEPGK